jgi:hypothetical protein
MVKGMGQSIINAVKGVFGIHSPSKVFRELGGYIVDGFGEGIAPIGELTSNGSINMKTMSMPSAGGDADVISAMYEAMSKALDDHVIDFNGRELGRLVRSYV